MSFNRRGLKINGHRRVGLGEGSLGGEDGTSQVYDIRTASCDRDMEIWIPNTIRGHSREDVETVWEVWRNDSQKDECRVQLEGLEKE